MWLYALVSSIWNCWSIIVVSSSPTVQSKTNCIRQRYWEGTSSAFQFPGNPISRKISKKSQKSGTNCIRQRYWDETFQFPGKSNFQTNLDKNNMLSWRQWKFGNIWTLSIGQVPCFSLSNIWVGKAYLQAKFLPIILSDTLKPVLNCSI